MQFHAHLPCYRTWSGSRNTSYAIALRSKSRNIKGWTQRGWCTLSNVYGKLVGASNASAASALRQLRRVCSTSAVPTMAAPALAALAALHSCIELHQPTTSTVRRQVKVAKVIKTKRRMGERNVNWGGNMWRSGAILDMIIPKMTFPVLIYDTRSRISSSDSCSSLVFRS